MFKTEDQTGLDGDAGIVQFLNAVQVTLGFIECFASFPEAGGHDGFQANEESLAPAGRSQVDEIIVIHDVECGLAGPTFA